MRRDGALRKISRGLWVGLKGLLIGIDGLVWLGGVAGIGAGWWVGAPPVRQLGVTLLVVMGGVHLACCLWPFHRLPDAVDRLLARTWGRWKLARAKERR